MTVRSITAPAFFLLGALIAGPSGAGDQTDRDGVIVAQPWVRATPPVEPINAAAYMVIRNHSDRNVRVTGVSTPLSDNASLHQSLTVDGQMRMQALPDGLVIPSGQTVKLEPIGYHIMMNGLDEPLKVGDSFPLTLNFAETEALTVDVQVLRERPMDDSNHSH